MTQGALIFAYNNETVDYVSMAAWSARNIHRHLGIPVCLVTDIMNVKNQHEFDQVINVDAVPTTQKRFFRDYKQTGTWHNLNRVNAHDLTPWDHTLLLDADYVVASDLLRCVLEIDQDFVSHDRADDISGNLPFQGNRTFGATHMPMRWATVIGFRRSRTSELIFGAMEMIRDNWQHYLDLYQISEPIYRNDFALSIAANLVEGHTLRSANIPWTLATLTPETRLTQIDQDTYKIEYQDVQERPRWMTIRQDFHAMCKQDLGEIVAGSS